MTTGKSFEYALLDCLYKKLDSITNVQVISNSSLDNAEQCFKQLSKDEQNRYQRTAQSAVDFLIEIEPKLSRGTDDKDVVQLEIASDALGKAGDVRDVLIKRSQQKWAIGISAKNNHNAVKHSRLSSKIDFGEKWIGVQASQEYFAKIDPIFNYLKDVRDESGATKKWSELGDYHSTVYKPILNAFMEELERIYETDNKKVASNLVSYLVGKEDFYKVIQTKGSVKITGYNLYGTLGTSYETDDVGFQVLQIRLPTAITNISMKKESDTTVIVELNNEWSLSFRIHNASSRVEASLKFDINLLKSPTGLFERTIILK